MECNIKETLQVVASVLNIIGVIFVLWQIVLSRKSVEKAEESVLLAHRSLEAARQSVDDAKLSRQLEILPNHGWVFSVNADLTSWIHELTIKSAEIRTIVKERNNDLLLNLFSSRITRPADLHLRKYDRENMPLWLSQLWVSAAQYYYNAIILLSPKWRIDSVYGLNSYAERLDESLSAIKIIQKYLSDMVPEVIGETPASINDDSFFT